MKPIERAQGFVVRADAALADPANMRDCWEKTIRSKIDERLVHMFPTAIDNAVRQLKGSFEHWDAFQPDQVEGVVTTEAFQVLSVLSAHPSGWVREEVVKQMANQNFDRFAGHLANRTLDFVPSIREAAQPAIWDALTTLHQERLAEDPSDELPSSANIVIARLMQPQAAMLYPELVQLSIAVGRTAKGDKPGRLRQRNNPPVALAPFHAALNANPSTETREALEATIDYITPDPT